MHLRKRIEFNKEFISFEEYAILSASLLICLFVCYWSFFFFFVFIFFPLFLRCDGRHRRYTYNKILFEAFDDTYSIFINVKKTSSSGICYIFVQLFYFFFIFFTFFSFIIYIYTHTHARTRSQIYTYTLHTCTYIYIYIYIICIARKYRGKYFL